MHINYTKSYQDIFLNTLAINKINVSVYLINGVNLQGIIIKYDKFSVFLLHNDHVQLIYKSAISTIMPSQPVSVFKELIRICEFSAAEELLVDHSLRKEKI